MDLPDAGDLEGLRAHLRAHPNLVHERVLFEGGHYFQNPSLLEFIAENPIRHGKVPTNVVELAKLILDAGAKHDQATLDETLALVCSGRVLREFEVQIPLLDLLCDYGADPNRGCPARTASSKQRTLCFRRGARLDLPVAAALGRVEDGRRLLLSANPEDRHRALALSAQFGHTEIVHMLLDAGERSEQVQSSRDPRPFDTAASSGVSRP